MVTKKQMARFEANLAALGDPHGLHYNQVVATLGLPQQKHIAPNGAVLVSWVMHRIGPIRDDFYSVNMTFVNDVVVKVAESRMSGSLFG